MKKYTLEQVLSKFRVKHGDKYNYSKVNYINCETEVCIICPDHGEFWQRPDSHIRGYGCPKCANKRRGKIKSLSTNEFIDKAIEIHGDKYDYSKVDYIGYDKPIIVICKKHGEYETTPNKHLHMKCDCPKCSNINLTTKDIIERFKEVHGDKYDYSEVNYVKMHEQVIIICPIHGKFKQTPNKHLHYKQGCPKCAREKLIESNRKTIEQFIKESHNVHGDKYDYSKVKYINSHTHVIITCPIHGDFKQRPYDHINGHSCPKCGIIYSSLEDKVNKILDDNKIEYIKEKTFDWLINKKNMYLDFYLPQYNIAIECQGKQHFGIGNWSEDKNIIFERDKRKYELCKEHGISIYYLHSFNNIPNCENDDMYKNNSFNNINILLERIMTDNV